ncbi:hypothetical protein KR51_00024150 [Rubidibacter lacunae KORDI 51-2]|uniref:Uncharacterized protein n=1 Tax=Rubidibacter lacunae KORDI 51-2 TaxID=582515 RepID=U5DHD8_9CHRO|nr:hypothetical protein KR51_00024150 [Rubidibacter lacunae KORDI 51-2]
MIILLNKKMANLQFCTCSTLTVQDYPTSCNNLGHLRNIWSVFEQ